MKKILTIIFLCTILLIPFNVDAASWDDVVYQGSTNQYEYDEYTDTMFRTSIMSYGLDTYGTYDGRYRLRMFATSEEIGTSADFDAVRPISVLTGVDLVDGKIDSHNPMDSTSQTNFSFIKYAKNNPSFHLAVDTVQVLANNFTESVQMTQSDLSHRKITVSSYNGSLSRLNVPMSVDTDTVDYEMRNNDVGFTSDFGVAVDSPEYVNKLYGQIEYQVTDGYHMWSVLSKENSIHVSLKE